MAQYPDVSVEFPGDGTTTIFDFNFPYQDTTEVFVSIDGTVVPYVWVAGSTHTVQVLPAPAVGTTVRIYRSTMAYNPRHLFAAGVPFLPRYVDENSKQLLYALQEGMGEFAEVAANADEALAGVQLAQQAAVAAQAAALAAEATTGRALRVPSSEPILAALPPAAERANKVLTFDAAGMPYLGSPASGSAEALALALANGLNPTEGASMVTFLGGNKLSTLIDGTDTALGASQLGYRRDISTLPGYLGDVLRLDAVRLLECIPKSQWAAIRAGTSVYDATARVQALIAQCASEGRSIVHDEGTVVVDYLEILPGLRGLFGKGGVKTNNLSTATALGVIICRGSFWGPFTGATGCYLGGLEVDASGGSKRCLMLGNFKSAVIDGIRTKGNDLTSASSGIRLQWDCADVAVVNCRITLPVITDSVTQTVYGIHAVSNDQTYSGWGSGNIVPALNPNVRISIHDNYISGGTHGISLTGARDFRVSGNYAEYSAHRNVHLINSRVGMVHNNFCLEAGSAAILAGYGCTDVSILANHCYSNQPGGEGGIEVYVWGRGIRVLHNRIRTGANYGIYLAIDIAGVQVAFNDIDMQITRRAAIGLESEWSGTADPLFPYSRPNYCAPPPGRTTWANGACSSVILQGNVVRNAPAGTCGIYVAQRAQAPVVLVSVLDNWVEDASIGHSYYFVEGTSGTLAQCGFQGNRTSYQNHAKVVATRGRAHFNSVMGNDTLNGDNWYRPSPTVNQPSVFYNDKLDLSTHTVNVNYFSGSKNGQTVTVRVHAGMTLVHNPGTMYLKGGVNCVCLDKQILVFENISGEFIEVSRNF